MECVLKGRQPLEDTVLVEELGCIAGDRLELRQRPCEALPQARERCCVPLALATRDARSHSPILYPRCSSPFHSRSTGQRQFSGRAAQQAAAPAKPARPSNGIAAMPWRRDLFIGIASDASALQWLPAMGGDGHTVLVVDDDDSLPMLCPVNLELEGYRVLEAPTVKLAEELLRDDSVDVVLLDVHVGSGDGFKVLGEIGGGRVALFTGSYEVDEQRAAEVDAVLRKPFTLTDLSETVGRLAAGESRLR